MTTTLSSPLDHFLQLLDRHVESSVTDPNVEVEFHASLARLKSLKTSTTTAAAATSNTDTKSTTSLSISPLERALYYEVDHRRILLERKLREVEFWQHYYDNSSSSSSSSSSLSRLDSEKLDQMIQQKTKQWQQLKGSDTLRTQLSKSLDTAVSIQKTLSTTSPSSSSSDTPPDRYSSTRDLLDDRDDKAIEFLSVFNQINQTRQQRDTVKVKIRDARKRTRTMLTEIKQIRTELASKQIQTQSSLSGITPQSLSTDSSQGDLKTLERVQKLQRSLFETRSKKELVKGILRGLILESGRDWTEKKEIRKLLLSLDDEPDDSDEEFLEQLSEEEAVGEQDEEEESENEDDEEEEEE